MTHRASRILQLVGAIAMADGLVQHALCELRWQQLSVLAAALAHDLLAAFIARRDRLDSFGDQQLRSARVVRLILRLRRHEQIGADTRQYLIAAALLQATHLLESIAALS